MYKRIASVVLATIMVVLAMPMYTAVAAEITATFNGLGYADQQQIPESTALDGFRFATSIGQGMDYCTSLGYSNSAGVVAHYAGPVAWVEFRRSDGGDFALRKIYYNAVTYSGSTQYRFDGYLDGTIIYTTGSIAISGTDTIEFTAWNQVDTVRITATAGGDLDVAAVFDDIVYEIVTVSPVPYMEINSTLTVVEGDTATINNSILKANDLDSVASTLQFTVTTGPTHGRLENSDSPGVAITTFTQGNIDSGKIRYVHDHTDTTSDSFVFKISDGVNELTGQTFNISVTPVYDDPLPDGASVATFDDLGGTYANNTDIPYTTAIDGFMFTSSTDLGMTYFSSGGQDNTPALKTSGSTAVTGLSIKRSDSSVFKLYTMFIYDSGSTLYTFGGYLGGAEVYTKADVNVNTLEPVTFEWDNIDEIRVSVTGTGADIFAFFDNIVYMDLASSPVPYLEINNPVTTTEGGTVLITNSLLKANDNDTLASTLQFTVTTAPVNGRLENSDSPGIAITTFTQGDIDNGKIRYVHDHTDTTSDSFVFKVSDGTYEVTGQTFNITVTPVYDDPLPAGASRATFDDLGGTYSNGQDIAPETAINNFVFLSSTGLGMTYNSSGGQDNTPALRTAGSTIVTSLSIKKSDSAIFTLITMYIHDSAAESTLYTFKGYLDGSEVYSKANLNVQTPVPVEFDWANIDEIRVSVSGIDADMLAFFDNIVYQNNDAAPVASDLEISGTATYGQELSGSYTYSDEESDEEGTSTFKWYRADNATGLNKTAISGAEAQTYLLSSADVGKYIGFGVTPIALTGTVTGSEVIIYTSSAVGKETPSISTAPSASAITYGQALSDSTLTGGSASVAGTFSWTAGTTEPSVSDSGETPYSVTFTPTDSANYNTTTTTVTLTVGKATPTITTAPTASAITYGQSLSDSELSGGSAIVAGTFSWTTGTTEPSVSDSGETPYSVTFTPTDSANYNETTTNVTLIVNKATPTITTAPSASAITYGQSLSDSELSGGSASVEGVFSWADETTEPSVSDSGETPYSVTFTPTDSSNYNTTTTTVTLIVGKATPVITTDPTASAITYGQMLSESILTSGLASVEGMFSWTTGTTEPSVSDSGVTAYSVTFTPADSANYDETTANVTLMVNKATPVITTDPTASAITYGQALSDSTLTGGSASVEGMFSWTTEAIEPSVSDSGVTTYSVTFTPTDSDNYGPATTTVTLTVNKATPTIITAPTASAITYGQALSDSDLTGGSASVAGTFSWTTEAIEPSVSDSGVTAYSVTFTPTDISNYYTTTTTVTLMVNKATPVITTDPTASAITYGQMLSDSDLTGGSASVEGTFSWTSGTTEPSVSDSGVTTYSVTFTPTDSDNYIETTTNVTLIVNKADATSPIAPILFSKTESTVLLTFVTGYEYIRVADGADLSTGTWQDSNEFTGLASTTAYDFYQRIKETTTHNASDVSTKLDVTTSNPVLTGTANITGSPVFGQTLTASLAGSNNTGTLSYQWVRGNSDIEMATDSTYTLVQADIGYQITVIIRSSFETGSVTGTPTSAVQKADAASAVAPVLSEKTTTIVTLVSVAGYEYIKVNKGADVSTGTWQDSNVFSGLSSGTPYDFYQRIKETATSKASATSSKLDVTTIAAPEVTPMPLPTSTPTPIPTATPIPTPTSPPTVSPTPKPTSTPTVSPTPKPTSTPTVSPTPKPTATPIPTSAPTSTPTSAQTSTPVPTVTETPDGTTDNNSQTDDSSVGISPIVFWIGGAILAVTILGAIGIIILKRRR